MSTKCIIAFDGERWFVRELETIEHDLEEDKKVYHCPRPISGPWTSPNAAAHSASAWLKKQKDGRITSETLRQFRELVKCNLIYDCSIEYRDGKPAITSVVFHAPKRRPLDVVIDTEIAARKIIAGLEAAHELAIRKQGQARKSKRKRK